tara:strand:- start:72 stop:629 length:558 start_codon:yes stop_codon:yes gene_type:complete
MRFEKCESCEKPMTGFTYEYSCACSPSLDFYEDYIIPESLICPGCNEYDWKHTHSQKRYVVYCENEDCQNQEYQYTICNSGHKLDYSRIPLWDRGIDAPIFSKIYKLIFGVSDHLKLKQLGRKMTIKEIEKEMKKINKLVNTTNFCGINNSTKLDYSDICDMVERDYYNKFGIKACLTYKSEDKN